MPLGSIEDSAVHPAEKLPNPVEGLLVAFFLAIFPHLCIKAHYLPSQGQCVTVPLPFFLLYQYSTLCPCDNNHPCGNKVAVCHGFGLRLPSDQCCHPWSGERCVPMSCSFPHQIRFRYQDVSVPNSGCLEPLLGSLHSLLLPWTLSLLEAFTGRCVSLVSWGLGLSMTWRC